MTTKEALLDQVRKNIQVFPLPQVSRILEAMRVIDRKFFVEDPYYDLAMLIGHGQTISQPSTVARMVCLLDVHPGQEVLEVGTGSGWNACLLAYLVYPGTVLSIERVLALVSLAKKNIEELKKHLQAGEHTRLTKLRVEEANVYALPAQKTFDRIIITAGIAQGKEEKIHRIADRHLRSKGLLLCPYQTGPLLIIRKTATGLTMTQTEEEYAFVPLVDQKNEDPEDSPQNL